MSFRFPPAVREKLARLVIDRPKKSATAILGDLIMAAPLGAKPLEGQILPAGANPKIRGATKPQTKETKPTPQRLVPRQSGKSSPVIRRQTIEKPDWKKRRDGEI